MAARFRRLPSAFVCLLVALPSLALGQAASQPPQAASPGPPAAFAPTDLIPLDSAVTVDTLPNGLRYYIRRNARPEKRVLLQLAVKAGSVDEEDDQQGLAHFLEHMAFNGTRRFKPGELVAALEQTGARMGPHVNAYTSFDETVYMFQLPTDREGVVEKGLQALADFAGGMTLDPAEIEKERGVVIEEWRGDLGAGARIRDQHIPVLYHQSKYANRLPIGKPEILKSFVPETLRAFYSKWYRPDRMAVVVIGDIDVERITASIRTEFGGIAKPPTAPPDRDYPVPLTSGLLVKTAADHEVTQSSISIVRRRPADRTDRVADYRTSLVRQLVSQIFNERFDEISRKPDAPFLNAAAYSNPISPTVTTFALAAAVQDGRIDTGLSALAVEAKRVERHGFGVAELERAKSWLVASCDRAYTERDKTESGAYAQEYLNHFLLGEPSPGIAYEYGLVKAVLPGIAVADVSSAARSLLLDDNRLILAVSPQKPNLKIPGDAELIAAVKAAEGVAVTPWNDAASGRTLMDRTPDPGQILARRDIPELGASVVRFANGVEAWFKPTDFKNDQVLFSLVASGGTSLADPAKFYEAQFASALAQLSGAGGHRAIELDKLLAGKLASASAFIAQSTHGISGSSTPAHLETALQLLNLRFTSPGEDPEAYALVRRQLEASLANRDRNPGIVFGEKVNEVNTMGHYMFRPLTLERLATLDRAAMLSFYRERFSNAADFTFFMVGAFRTADVLPLVARYVGSLPSTGKALSRFRDVGLRFPPQTVRERVAKGTEPKAQAVLSFFADPPIEENEQARVEAATEVLEIRLRDVLREELGEAYSVSVGLSQQLPQRGGGRISIRFGGAPENIDRMIDRSLQEVARLQKEGPPDDLTARAKESAKREHETALKENAFWLGRLQSAKLLGRDPLLILTRLNRIDAISSAVLHETFKTYFPLDRRTVVTLLPDKQ